MKTLQELLTDLNGNLAEIRKGGGDAHRHGGSRFAGPGASDAVLDTLAKGGSVGGEFRIAERDGSTSKMFGGGGGRDGGAAGFAKALAEATDTAGGYLVPADVSTDIAAQIFPRSAVLASGVTTIPGVRKSLMLPAVSSSAAASWGAENSAIGVSAETFAPACTLVPKRLAAMVPVSNKLLRDLSPQVAEVVRNDLAQVLAVRADLSFIQGIGTTEPLGVKNTAGLTAAPDLGVNGRALTFDDLMDTVGALRAANAPFTSPGWIFHSRTLQSIMKLKDGQGRYLGEEQSLLSFNPVGAGGTLLGIPFRTTNQIPVNVTRGTSNNSSFLLLSSDWSESYLGVGLDLELDVSQEASYTPDGTQWVSAYQNDQSLLRALWWVDYAVRRPQLFTCLSGITP